MTVPGSNLPISFFSLSLRTSSSQPNSLTHFHALLIYWDDRRDLAYFADEQSKSKTFDRSTRNPYFDLCILQATLAWINLRQ